MKQTLDVTTSEDYTNILELSLTPTCTWTEARYTTWISTSPCSSMSQHPAMTLHTLRGGAGEGSSAKSKSGVSWPSSSQCSELQNISVQAGASTCVCSLLCAQPHNTPIFMPRQQLTHEYTPVCLGPSSGREAA